jgi:probable lipoprotein NlpC
MALASAAAFAEAPVAVGAPKAARSRILVAAESYEGVPYRLGGTDRTGIDCSGLVFSVFRDAVSVKVPRTARTQFFFCEALDPKKLQIGDLVFFNTDGPLAHVGIYSGEGRFIHAASDGPSTGVIESSLSDPSWRRSFAGAGRVIPPAEYLGITLRASLGPEFGSDPALRGVSASLGLGYRVFGIGLGLEARPEYDALLGVARLPAVLRLELGKDLGVFAGPALTIGKPGLGSGSGARSYSASGGLLATAGIVWTPLRFKLAGQDLGLYGELVYNRYVPDVAAAAGSDARASFSAGMGLCFSWGL